MIQIYHFSPSKMLAFVLLPLLSAGVSVSPDQVRFSSYSGEYGGSSGQHFDQSQNQLDGPITALRIAANDKYIVSIQVCYGDSWSNTEGSLTGSPSEVQLFPGEGFVQVLGRFTGYVEYLAFRTNLGRLFAFGPGFSSGTTFNAEPLFPQTVLRFISGRSGSLVDAIGFHWDKQP
ncbi:zymogen granule membrane protein 16-like isoform X2 [Hemicordylus capensis]|uniref:zymogen granule membrane protein 16-like isoform X2 n=1 Tax=Hemicordylus capensis TaxID=884348 RepID=UPI0023024D32|nr:zymogen granule membrane protein 16-like isoform X2 [Hemicordylus capensis]